MRINIFSDSGSLNHFLVDEVIDFVVIDEHDSAVFSGTHRQGLNVLKIGRISWFSKQTISNKLTSTEIIESILPLCLQIELDSLRQWKCFSKVDGVRLPAHIHFP